MRLWVVYMGNDRQVRCPLLMEFLLSTEKLAPFLPQQEMPAGAKCCEPERVRRQRISPHIASAIPSGEVPCGLDRSSDQCVWEGDRASLHNSILNGSDAPPQIKRSGLSAQKCSAPGLHHETSNEPSSLRDLMEALWWWGPPDAPARAQNVCVATSLDPSRTLIACEVGRR